MEKKQISLIISVYNDIRFLKMIFEMLKKQSLKNFEVIIADDGSDENFVEAVENLKNNSPFPVIHVWHPDNGWQKNIILNKAIVASNTDYLVFIDGDCIPHRKFLEDHFKSAKRNTVIAGRRIQLTKEMSEEITPEKVRDNYLPKNYFRFWKAYFKKEIPHGKNLLRITNPLLRKIFVTERNKGILGCNFSIWKKDILLINGFDERFLNPGLGEDTDIEARLVRAGVNICVKNHMLLVYHKYHFRGEVKGDNNPALYAENNEKRVTYTPYGIKNSK